MTTEFYDYNLKAVTCVAMGIPITGGHAEDDFVTIEPTGPMYVTKTGADGTKTRCKTNDKGAIIKIRLAQGAKINAALSALYNLDAKSENGAGVGPFVLRDENGASLHAASKCWITGPPSCPYGKESGVREWTLEAADMDTFVGGN